MGALESTAGARTSDSRLSAALAAIRDAVPYATAPSRRNLLHWLSWVLTLSVVLILTFVLAGGQVYSWEREVVRRVQEADFPAWVFSITSNRFTDAYDGVLITVLAASALWFLRHRLEAALVAFVFPLHVVGNFPKAIVARERPSELFEGIVGVGTGKSFPSGHAEFAVTFFGFLAYLLLIHVRGRVQRAAVILAWLVFAVLVGLGRVDEGRHWPLDVLTGYVVGIGLLSGLIWLHTALRRANELGTAATADVDTSANGEGHSTSTTDSSLTL